MFLIIQVAELKDLKDKMERGSETATAISALEKTPLEVSFIKTCTTMILHKWYKRVYVATLNLNFRAIRTSQEAAHTENI